MVRTKIKCLGRFSEFREYLFSDSFEMAVEGRTRISSRDLRELWDLVDNDIYSYDTKDPYFASTVDKARKVPLITPNSLIALFPKDYVLERGLISVYAFEQGMNLEVAQRLEQMASHGDRFLVEILCAETREISLGHGKDLRNYSIQTNFGVGTLSDGGVLGGGVRSDSPFLIGIYKKEVVGEKNLALVIGFWAQNNRMLVSQIQPCKNAVLPRGISLGLGGLMTAEFFARRMGLQGIEVYTARSHPIFREHPQGWIQYGQDFIDNSDKVIEIIGGYTLSKERECFVKNF